jgi:hypothetical protein
MNWVEYVRRDTEGSDSDTRRRAASELVKSLTDQFPEQVRVWRESGCGCLAQAPAATGCSAAVCREGGVAARPV